LADAVTFRDARRELRSLTGAAEKRVLGWLAARMPAAINSDHLTALGLLSLMATGAAYALSGGRPWLLLVVNALLVLNWFGDSLDGTLARHRNRCRPRYGFYVDHLVDMVGALFLLGGLTLSGYVTPWVATWVLIAYLMLAIHIYLETYTLGVFKIAYGGLGGTELRLLLAAANVVLMLAPRLTVGGWSVLVADVAGVVVMAGLVVTLVASVARTTRTLYRLERL
jgi:phosphatidylglycerophosphate synthase